MGWFRRRLDDEDFQEEIRAHLKIAADERVADGADPKSAHLDSLKEFGNVTLTTDAARKVWTPWWLEAIHDQISDVTYAVRALAKNPVFSLTVVGVLTLGIGLNAGVFAMLKGLALNPLAGVERSSQLATVFRETSSGRALSLSYPDFQFLRDNDRSFTGLMGSISATVGLGRGRGSRPLWSEIVTGNYFQVLGVRASLGRTLLPSDETAPGGNPVAVISDGLWRRDFAADPGIVGKTVEINSWPLTIVGVADPAFHGSTVVYDVEVYIPVTMAPQLGFNFGSRETTPAGILGDRRTTMFQPQGFLRPDVTIAAAAAQADALWTTRSQDRALTDASDRLRVVPFRQSPGGAPSIMLPTLGVLAAMGLFVLLIACANIAGLVLVRGLSRQGEIALRLALGATRTRIVRLLIVENLVLALPGALLGVILASRGMPLVVDWVESLAAPQRVFLNIGVDRVGTAFAVLIACGSAMAFGFVPALQSSRIDLITVMSDVSTRGTARSRFRTCLVVAQVAVSLLLLVGSGLVSRSLEAARNAYPGYDPSHVASVTVDLKQNGYDEASGRVFYRKLLDAAKADAANESATLGAYAPMAFLETPTRRFAIEGYVPRRGEDVAFLSNTIGPVYFRTLRIALLAGREFDDRDDAGAAPVAIVNATLAQRFWGGPENAIGKRVRAGDGEWRTVVGVAADVKYIRVNESPRPYVYLPFLQDYHPRMALLTRGPAPTDVLVEQSRAHVVALDADLPILFARPLADQINGALMLFSLTATMLLVFGAAGMALAAMGTYGLVSYAVKQRTHEIGIRMALGATAPSVVREFLSGGVRLGGIGVAIGFVAALALMRLLSAVLFGVSATDPVSYGRALALVMAIVIAATLVPAWRASRTNPLQALRHQ